MEITDYIDVRRELALEEISFGYSTVTLFQVSELEKAQVGYSIGVSGEDFTGTNEGDWKSSWLVIGFDGTLGDPIFIDLNDYSLPVYTAMHGEGDWNPEKISASLDGFIEALRIIDRISEGREYPVALQRNPLPRAEEKETLVNIATAVGDVSLEFWELWFRVY